MRHLITTAVAAIALSVLWAGGSALAGDPAPTGEGVCEIACPNHCPLAKSANELRTNGSEAVASSTVVRDDVRREALVGLARI